MSDWLRQTARQNRRGSSLVDKAISASDLWMQGRDLSNDSTGSVAECDRC